MASKCFMCGAAISEGILCEKCDKPRRAKPKTESGKTPLPPPAEERPSPGAEPVLKRSEGRHPLPASRGEGKGSARMAPGIHHAMYRPAGPV